ncbi:MAG: cupredoxin family copper-binding protein [Planctomycetota bacterium]|nr:cupredoxin family copper-binding protein [Planctomycetota bacterium]
MQRCFGSLFFVLLLLCGMAGQAANAATTSVSIVNFSFQPETVAIAPGDTVTWTNNDAAPHTATSDTSDWGSGILTAGTSFSFTFNTIGSFPYHCTFNPAMHGIITVSSSVNITNIVLHQTGMVGKPFSFTITAKGPPPIALSAAPLPPGLTFSDDTISGTPTTAGTFAVVLGADGPGGSDTDILTISISGATDVTGTWSGKFKDKTYSQKEGTKAGAARISSDKTEAGTKAATGSGDASVTFTQSGTMLNAAVVLTDKAEEIERVYYLCGQIGNNNYWLMGTNSDASETITLSGQVNSKKADSMKGTVITTSGDGAAEIIFNLKKAGATVKSGKP